MYVLFILRAPVPLRDTPRHCSAGPPEFLSMPQRARPRWLTRRRYRWFVVAGAFLSQFWSTGSNWAYGVYSVNYCSSNSLGTDGQQRLCALPGSLAVASWSVAGLVVGRV